MLRVSTFFCAEGCFGQAIMPTCNMLMSGNALQVPWQRLGQEPVVAEFDRLYIVAGPREDLTEASEGCKDPEQQEAAALKAEQDAKEKRVAAAEKAWIKVGMLSSKVILRDSQPAWCEYQQAVSQCTCL